MSERSKEITDFAVEQWLEIEKKYRSPADQGALISHLVAFFFANVDRSQWQECWDILQRGTPKLVEALERDIKTANAQKH